MPDASTPAQRGDIGCRARALREEREALPHCLASFNTMLPSFPAVSRLDPNATGCAKLEGKARRCRSLRCSGEKIQFSILRLMSRSYDSALFPVTCGVWPHANVHTSSAVSLTDTEPGALISTPGRSDSRSDQRRDQRTEPC